MIMSGTSRRLPGLPGRLGLLSVAAVLLPIGASWAQKPEEPREVKVVVRSADTVDFVGPVEVRHAADDKVAAPSEAKSVVIVEFDVPDQSLDRIKLSGSLDEVMKKLETIIVDLKKEGESRPESKEKVESLVKVLDSLKQVRVNGRSVKIVGNLQKPGAGTHADAYVARLVEKVSKGDKVSEGDKAREVAQARQELSRLKGELKATLGRLVKAQARLRELGEDPGEAPDIRWQVTKVHPKVEMRTVVVGKAETVTAEPKEGRLFVREMRLEPDPTQRQRLELHRVQGKVATAHQMPDRTQQQRLEQLEKRLKSLQDEFDRLKKGSADSAPKK